MAQALFQTVADQIAQRLSRDSEYRIPATAGLAREHGVSLNTACKAIALLKQRGLVRAHQGRKIERCDQPAPDSRRSEAEVRLHARIKQSILDGSLRAAEPLPKIDHYARTLHISRLTVTRALTELARDRLIHKLGKRWIVGVPESTTASARPDAATCPVVLFVMANDERLQNLFPNHYLAPFVNAFFDEMMKRGIRVQLAHRSPPVLGEFPMPHGIDALRSEIRRLGDRYRGAVLVDELPTEEEFVPFMSELSCFGKKPAVLFDPSEVQASFTRRIMSGNRNFYRLHFDERTAVQLALRALVDAGHRTIGVPVFSHPGYFWVQRRFGHVTSLVARISPTPAIVTADMSEPFWVLASTDPQGLMTEFTKRLDGCLGPTPAPGRKRQSQLRAVTPSMTTLLDKGVTALLCPNDAIAYQFWMWLGWAGLPVPRHMSMISFDNSIQARLYPISTIDFGFSRLGYVAAHILIDDIPVSADADGNIGGPCTVVERGSVGRRG